MKDWTKNLRVEKFDDTQWGVVGSEGIFEPDLFPTKHEAQEFLEAIRIAHQLAEANDRYWSQTIFGE